ncbi:MAG: urease accessory protein UreE [Pararhizobium sp.]
MRTARGWRAAADETAAISGTVTLAHDQRHLRRKRLVLDDGEAVLVDLAEAVMLPDGAVLLLDDGGLVRVAAAEEPLYAVTGRDPLHLLHLAWHLGNRHLAVEIDTDRILIARDHVIQTMVEGLGGTVEKIVAAFTPISGAYHGHGEHGHDDHGPGGHGNG